MNGEKEWDRKQENKKKQIKNEIKVILCATWIRIKLTKK